MSFFFVVACILGWSLAIFIFGSSDDPDVPDADEDVDWLFILFDDCIDLLASKGFMADVADVWPIRLLLLSADVNWYCDLNLKKNNMNWNILLSLRIKRKNYLDDECLEAAWTSVYNLAREKYSS